MVLPCPFKSRATPYSLPRTKNFPNRGDRQFMVSRAPLRRGGTVMSPVTRDQTHLGRQVDVGPTSARASSIGFDENAGAARADVKSGPFSLTG